MSKKITHLVCLQSVVLYYTILSGSDGYKSLMLTRLQCKCAETKTHNLNEINAVLNFILITF